MTKPIVFRPGDRVRVIKPERFIRCGYPLGEDDMRREIDNNPEIQAALELLAAAAGIPKLQSGGFMYDQPLKRELAYAMLKSRSFGGRDRRLYFKPCHELLGLEFAVYKLRTVHTGSYYGPSGYGGDYEPGGLVDRKTHRVAYMWSWDIIQSTGDPLAFPVTHLEKVE